MTTALADWIRTLTGAAIFCAIAFAICPKGRPRQVLSLACGCVMAVALLSPVAGLDVTSLAMAAARYNQAARETVSDAQEASRGLERAVIESECEAYISDRADALGLADTGADVTARWIEEGFWYPWECALGCGYDASLAAAIEAELGIPPERVSWEAQS